MSLESTRETLEAYWREHDPQYVAEDAVFTIVATGEEVRGREAISEHLHHFYHEAFDARAEQTNSIFGEGKGTLEAHVVGTHTGEFAGIPATGREVRVPLCVTYDVADGQITRARVYLMVSVLMKQIAPVSVDA